MLHFFIRVVFLAELEILEITKRKKNVTESRLGAKFKIELIICIVEPERPNGHPLRRLTTQTYAVGARGPNVTNWSS